MRIPCYSSGLTRFGARASALGVLLIPILFAAAELVARGARSAPAADALYAAAYSEDPGVMRVAIAGLVDVDAPDHCRYTPLALMVAYARLDGVEMLLERGAAVDVGHPLLGTPLMLALRNGNEPIARALLERGADVNVRCAGFDPLASAVAGNDPGCVRLALDAGADPHAPHRRYNLLTLAVQTSEVEVMRELLRAGVDPNLPDADGSTPLLHAVECGATESARLLLLAGADASWPRAGGRTPLGVAHARGCRDMIELLGSVTE